MKPVDAGGAGGGDPYDGVELGFDDPEVTGAPPHLDSADTIRSKATDFKSKVKTIHDRSVTIKHIWGGIAPHYKAPESHLVTTAMNKPESSGSSMLKSATTVAKALSDYAGDLDALSKRRTELLSRGREINEDKAALDKEKAESTDWLFGAETTDFFGGRERGIMGRANDWNHDMGVFREDLDTAQRDCINVIRGVYGAPPLKPADRISVEDNKKGLGYGFSEETYEQMSLSNEAGYTAKGAWNPDNAINKGKVLVEGGVESVKEMWHMGDVLITGGEPGEREALVSGLKQLGKDLAVYSSPLTVLAMATTSSGRKQLKESGSRLIEVGKASIGYGTWKTSGLRTAGGFLPDILMSASGAGAAKFGVRGAMKGALASTRVGGAMTRLGTKMPTTIKALSTMSAMTKKFSTVGIIDMSARKAGGATRGLTKSSAHAVRNAFIPSGSSAERLVVDAKDRLTPRVVQVATPGGGSFPHLTSKYSLDGPRPLGDHVMMRETDGPAGSPASTSTGGSSVHGGGSSVGPDHTPESRGAERASSLETRESSRSAVTEGSARPTSRGADPASSQAHGDRDGARVRQSDPAQHVDSSPSGQRSGSGASPARAVDATSSGAPTSRGGVGAPSRGGSDAHVDRTPESGDSERAPASSTPEAHGSPQSSESASQPMSRAADSAAPEPRGNRGGDAASHVDDATGNAKAADDVRGDAAGRDGHSAAPAGRGSADVEAARHADPTGRASKGSDETSADSVVRDGDRAASGARTVDDAASGVRTADDVTVSREGGATQVREGDHSGSAVHPQPGNGGSTPAGRGGVWDPDRPVHQTVGRGRAGAPDTYTQHDVDQALRDAPRNQHGDPVDHRTGEPLRVDEGHGRRWHMKWDVDDGRWVPENPGSGVDDGGLPLRGTPGSYGYDEHGFRMEYAHHRPSFRKRVVEEVWKRVARIDADGRQYVRVPDEAGKRVRVYWEPGTSRRGVWDMGHVQDEKYSEQLRKYLNHELDPDPLKNKQEFLDWFNDPENYRVEHWLRNQSHLDE